MSIKELSQRPVFQDSEDVAALSDRPPFSRLAVVAFVIGLLSLCAAFSTVVLPLAMLSLGLGAVVVWKLSRDTAIGGSWLAQLGLGLSALAVAWSVSARVGIERYMYEQASHHAKVMLNMLSAGKLYEALELKQPVAERQLASTNLEKYYNALPDEKQYILTNFRDAQVTKDVIAAGPQADWQFLQGASLDRENDNLYVSVDMINRAAEGKPQRVRVQLMRQVDEQANSAEGEYTAMWNVQDLVDPTVKPPTL